METPGSPTPTMQPFLDDILYAGAPLCLAVLFACPLGLERELTGKPAGLRTHLLVALGAAGFVVAAVAYADNGQELRAVQGVATGIGFVGAGAILQSRRHVHGLTTAVSIWIAASIGAACGLREYPTAAVVAVLTLLVLLLDRWRPIKKLGDPERDENAYTSAESRDQPTSSESRDEPR